MRRQISFYTKKVGLSMVSTKLVQKQPREDQKASRMTIAKEQLAPFSYDENKFLNCIVTGDKMWVHYSEHAIKAQSKQYKRVGFPPPKTLNLSPSAGKVMWVVFRDSRGIILAYFMPECQTATAGYSSEVILNNKNLN